MKVPVHPDEEYNSPRREWPCDTSILCYPIDLYYERKRNVHRKYTYYDNIEDDDYHSTFNTITRTSTLDTQFRR